MAYTQEGTNGTQTQSYTRTGTTPKMNKRREMMAKWIHRTTNQTTIFADLTNAQQRQLINNYLNDLFQDCIKDQIKYDKVTTASATALSEADTEYSTNVDIGAE